MIESSYLNKIYEDNPQQKASHDERLLNMRLLENSFKVVLNMAMLL